MTLWTCSSSWTLRGRMTPIWRNSSTDTWVEVPLLPLNLAKAKGLKIPLTPTRVVVKGGLTYVP